MYIKRFSLLQVQYLVFWVLSALPCVLCVRADGVLRSWVLLLIVIYPAPEYWYTPSQPHRHYHHHWFWCNFFSCTCPNLLLFCCKVAVILEIMTKIYKFSLLFLVCQPNFDISKEHTEKPNFSKVIEKLEIVIEMAKMLNQIYVECQTSRGPSILLLHSGAM